VFVVELDLVDFEAAVPLGLVPETVGERTIGVLLGDEELHRFRVVKLGDRIQTQAQSLTRLTTTPGWASQECVDLAPGVNLPSGWCFGGWCD